MKDNRVQAKIDGTHLLATLSAHALKSYLGGSKAQSFVFGTSVKGSFIDKVDNLCHMLFEGSGCRKLDDAAVSANDDKLDTVAWVPFADRLPGQLIIFAQCKTCTNWRDSMSQLRPATFVGKWMREPILVEPLRAYCISEAASRSTWKGDNLRSCNKLT
jgi:hypothetical protein